MQRETLTILRPSAAAPADRAYEFTPREQMPPLDLAVRHFPNYTNKQLQEVINYASYHMSLRGNDKTTLEIKETAH
jgi:hypothetical protein